MARPSPAWVALLVAAAIVAGSVLALADTWPLFRHDGQNTGTSSDPVELPLALAWRVRLFQPGGEADPRASYIVGDDRRPMLRRTTRSRRLPGA